MSCGLGGQFLVKMTNMSQGLADNERVGDEIYLKSIHVDLLLKNEYDSTSNPRTLWRVFIFSINKMIN